MYSTELKNRLEHLQAIIAANSPHQEWMEIKLPMGRLTVEPLKKCCNHEADIQPGTLLVGLEWGHHMVWASLAPGQDWDDVFAQMQDKLRIVILQTGENTIRCQLLNIIDAA